MSSSSRISALGLDVGKKRIGVAGCDGTGLIATGLTTIERRSFQDDVEQLRDLVKGRQVEILVVGLPYNMDGSVGFQAKQVQKFSRRLGQALQLPVEFVDERLTSFQAEQLLQAENRAPSRHKALIDRKAAAIILQQWLDDRRRTNGLDQPRVDQLRFDQLRFDQSKLDQSKSDQSKLNQTLNPDVSYSTNLDQAEIS